MNSVATQVVQTVVYPPAVIQNSIPSSAGTETNNPVCVSSLFDEVSEQDYGTNRRIDQVISAMSWDDVEKLLAQAGVLRPERLLAIAKKTVRDAKRL